MLSFAFLKHFFREGEVVDRLIGAPPDVVLEDVRTRWDDILGAVTVTLGLALLALGVSQGPQVGFGSIGSGGVMTAGIVLLGLIPRLGRFTMAYLTVAVLGVKVLLVLGHTGCGAVKAAMKADAVPGQISALYQYLQPSVEDSGGDFGQAIANNAKFQANLLRTSSTVVRDALKVAKVRVESGVYDLATGKVTLHG